MPDDLSPAGVRPGDVLAGKYVVERVLGVGGMGVVVAAHHLQLDTKVALKFLLPSMLTDLEAVNRFAREARAAVRITSEHVARVLDVGVLETGAPYIVMEFLDGGDLAAWIEQRGPLPLDQAVEFVLQASIAIAEAHGMGIVHRDLKPANLFCVRRPDGQLSIKVLDFGISKLTGAGRASQPPPISSTKTSAIMGSPFYMSPEQMKSTKTVDSQTDIWALGVILYELVSGKLPFKGDSIAEVAINVATEVPVSVRVLRPEIPVALEGAIFKCLAKERRDRFGNVAELAIAIAPFAPRHGRALLERIHGTIQAAGLSGSALALPPTPKMATTVASSETFPPTGNTRPAPSSERRVGAWVALAALVLVLGSGAVAVRLALLRRGSGPAGLDSALALADGSSLAAASATSTVPVVLQPSLVETDAGVWPPAASSLPVTPATAAIAATARPNGSRKGVAPPAPGCDPPFTLDDQGRKRFKPECYLKK